MKGTMKKATSTAMTKAERAELLRLARMRGNVAKKDLEARGAAQLAEVETQLARRYERHHEAWKHITAAAEKMIQEADAQIADLCKQMGVPETFRPGLSLSWWARGESASKERRAELRQAAEAQIKARVRAGNVEIDRAVVRISAELVAEGLTSEKAQAFFASMPTSETLLPALQLPDLEQTKSRMEEHIAEEIAEEKLLSE